MSPQNQDDEPSSGVASPAWYGELPARWTLSPARAIFSEVKSVGHGSQPMLSVTIASGVIPQATLLAGSSKKDSSNLDKSKYKLVEVGDIAYNKMRAWQGAIGLSKYRGIVSPAYVVVRPRNTDARYLENLMRTPAFAKEAERWSYGITSDMWSLRPEHFKMIYFPIPPTDEQDAIVKYLGHAHARIDRAIAAKRKLIALLEEQKKAIIHQAVTRGLDPTVPLKDSGIPWLGEIPAHWEVQPLKRLIVGKLEYGANEAAVHTIAEWPRYIRITDFGYDGRLRPDTFRSLPPETASNYEVIEGDVLLARSGATVGKSFLVPAGLGPACHAGYLIRARCDTQRLLPEFFYLFTRSAPYARWKGAILNRATIENIGADKYAQVSVPVPPLAEQRVLLSALEAENKVPNEVISRSVQEIELLREFRTRLTSDVVTGQVDVREIAATLPELTDNMLASPGNDAVDTDGEDVEDFTEGEDD